jgi:hypothetical protein
MGDPKGAKAASDGAKVTANNVISVVLEDLSEKDREEVERELEEEMAERHRKKLACFQKTRSGVVKKGETTRVSVPVNSSFTLEELVHMIDVSINSKYDANLEGFTRTLTDSLRSSLESFKFDYKQDVYNNLHKQVRSMVQQVLGEGRGKRDTDTSPAGNTNSGASGVATQGSPSTASRTRGVGAAANPSFQQPYYQAIVYGPNLQLVLDSYYMRPPAIHLATEGIQSGMTESVRDQVTRTLREFGLEPRGRAKTYQKPYPEFFDTMPYPRGFRVLDFVKFTGEDSKTTYEHIGQFLAQVSDYSITDVHKIRLFPLSLFGTVFNWFVSLAPNTVNTWEHLEQKFHDYFFNGEFELRLSHLAAVKQNHNESVSEYMRRFRETRNKCYSLTIGDRDLAELAFVGLVMALKDHMEGQDFTDVNHMLQRALAQEGRIKEHKVQNRFRENYMKEKLGVNCVGGLGKQR